MIINKNNLKTLIHTFKNINQALMQLRNCFLTAINRNNN